MKYCALCCIAKDEDAFLKEWLAYHALIGFEHFVIYDNVSARPIADLLGDWANPADVTVIRNREELSQKVVYGHCLREFGSAFKWIAFLDLDEFIRLSPGCGDIRVFLAEFEPYAGLGLNWRVFSSGGHEKTPRGPVIANYTRCIGTDPYIKSVVQPAWVAGCAGPHSFYPREGRHTVNARHFPIAPGFPFTVSAADRIAVNHYFYKSRECFARKIAKGNPCDIERRMEHFDAHLPLETTPDEALLPLLPPLRAAMRAESLRAAAGPGAFFGGDSKEALNAARAAIQEGRDTQAVQRALLCLCYEAMRPETAAGEAPRGLDIWLMRAQAARAGRDYALAEHCLKQVFMLGAERRAFTELAALLLETGRRDEVSQALTVLRTFEEQGA